MVSMILTKMLTTTRSSMRSIVRARQARRVHKVRKAHKDLKVRRVKLDQPARQVRKVQPVRTDLAVGTSMAMVSETFPQKTQTAT